MMIMIMMTATTAKMMMIISMENARNSRGSGLPGSGYRWATALAKLDRDYDARDHVLTAEEI
jgi:hypothetical protein